MQIHIRNLIGFLDDPRRGDNKHASGVIGVIGEDLNAAAFKHYMEGKGITVTLGKKSPTTGKKKGKRLDRWIHAKNNATGEETLYQAEIKNWAGSAIGGYRLTIDCTEEQIKKAAVHYWAGQEKKHFHLDRQPNGVTKVFLKMKPTEFIGTRIEPLLIYWMPMSNTGAGDMNPFFRVPVSELKLHESLESEPFEYLNVFSVSYYLRNLLKNGTETISLSLPNAERRLQVFQEITAA